MFSDGRTVGATLDRNGLRPARYWRTSDDFVYVASEVGLSCYFLLYEIVCSTTMLSEKIVLLIHNKISNWNPRIGAFFYLPVLHCRYIDTLLYQIAEFRCHKLN
jgi:hypothetical protein